MAAADRSVAAGMDDVERVLLRREAIEKRVRELGAEITATLPGDGPPLLAVSILRGAVIFAADLVRAIDGMVEMDFMAVSSYGSGSVSSGEVRVLKDLDESIEGRDVLIVEDIIDTGHTLSFLLANLRTRKPRSLRICTLLDKADRREVDVPVDFVGFRIPDAFVVGYGLDYAGHYRNYPELLVLRAQALKS